MVEIGGYEQAFGVEVGAVDKDLVIDALTVHGYRWLDVPKASESSLQRRDANTVVFRYVMQRVSVD